MRPVPWCRFFRGLVIGTSSLVGGDLYSCERMYQEDGLKFVQVPTNSQEGVQYSFFSTLNAPTEGTNERNEALLKIQGQTYLSDVIIFRSLDLNNL